MENTGSAKSPGRYAQKRTDPTFKKKNIQSNRGCGVSSGNIGTSQLSSTRSSFLLFLWRVSIIFMESFCYLANPVKLRNNITDHDDLTGTAKLDSTNSYEILSTEEP